MKVLIVAGGSSSERKISLISGRAVRNALIKTGHEAVIFDYKKGRVALKKMIRRFDVVFPVMHGKEGEDGSLYSFLKAAKRPFVGSDPKGAKIAFDKILFKKYCNKHGVPTAQWQIIKNTEDIRSFGFPCVLKAASGGSSHEVALLYSASDLSDPKVKKILRLRDSFYVEKLIDGVEITMGVLGGNALPVVEIVPPDSGWFDYENKYSGRSREIPFSPSVPRYLQSKAQQMAAKIHEHLKLGSYSRTDVIVKNNILYVLEANTPGGVGLTPQSLFPKAAKASGMSFEELIENIVERTLEDQKN
jgi:D-alanine-D-alanine ligase